MTAAFIEVEVEPIAGSLTLKGRPVAGLCVITDPYGTPRNNWIGKHTGTDVAPVQPNPSDEDIALRPCGGAVLNWIVIDGGRNANGGVGNMTELLYDNGLRSRYFHQREFSPRIQAWIDGGYDPATRPYLEPDEVVGIMGNTGFVYGAGGATPGPGDLQTGRHLHWEMVLPTGESVDPMQYVIDVPEVHFTPVANPKPVSIVEPERIETNFVAAWNEARLLRTLIQMMLDVPLDIAEALDAIARECDEIVYAYGLVAGSTLDEARVLAQTARILRDAGAPEGYVATLEAMRGQAVEMADALKAATPAAA